MTLTKTAGTPGNSPFASLITMFYDPAQTFANLAPRRAAWLPVIALTVSNLILMLWFLNSVDFSWLQDQILATIKDTAQREQSKHMMTKGMFMSGTLGGTVIILPLVMATVAFYFMLIAKFLNKTFSFGTGFALAAWAMVPGLLLLPLGGVQILLASHGQLGFSELNPLSINQLFFRYDMNHPMASLLDSLSLSSIWTMVLQVIGFQAWGQVTRATAIKVVAIPYLLIYGVWFVIAMKHAV